MSAMQCHAVYRQLRKGGAVGGAMVSGKGVLV